MALADSSENAILDLSKRVANEDYCTFENNNNVWGLISNSNVKIFTDKISEKEEPGSKNPSPDSPLFSKTHNETLQKCSASVSPNPGDVHSFASNSITSALASNDRQMDRMWMRTLPHRKRPINLFKSIEESSGTDAKRVKTGFLGKGDFMIKNHCSQMISNQCQSPPERIQTKSASRTRTGQLKDEAYWERRRKNNEAAKRSRDTRKQKEEETAHKARSLAQENISLRAEINILRTQLCNMQSMLFYRGNAHSLL